MVCLTRCRNLTNVDFDEDQDEEVEMDEEYDFRDDDETNELEETEDVNFDKVYGEGTLVPTMIS